MNTVYYMNQATVCNKSVKIQRKFLITTGSVVLFYWVICSEYFSGNSIRIVQFYMQSIWIFNAYMAYWVTSHCLLDLSHCNLLCYHSHYICKVLYMASCFFDMNSYWHWDICDDIHTWQVRELPEVQVAQDISWEKLSLVMFSPIRCQ